jgi:hypothetical protein
MRTTVTMSDELYRSAKAHAALTGQTVGSVIEDALRLLLSTAPPEQPPIDLPVFDAKVRPGIDLADGSALLDALDEGAVGSAAH